MPSTGGKKLLLLGMVYAQPPSKSRTETFGQECRDRIRCEALAGEFDVYTLDDKHGEESAVLGKHCQANFADPRRMISSMCEVWRDTVSFDEIILDYFFLPSGWAAQRWTEKFFQNTLPLLAEWNILRAGGSLWLPHVSHTSTMMKEFSAAIGERYSVELVEDPLLNPLYAATETVAEELIRASPKVILTNATQLPYLLKITTQPFYRLTARERPLVSSPSTPSCKRQKLSPCKDRAASEASPVLSRSASATSTH